MKTVQVSRSRAGMVSYRGQAAWMTLRQHFYGWGIVFVSESQLDQYTWSQIYQNDNFPCREIEVNILMSNADFIDKFYLDYCNAVSIGDVVSLIGMPVRYDLSHWGFGDGKIVFFTPYHSVPNNANTCLSYVPQGHVGGLALSAKDQLYQQETLYLWHGFLPYDIYVQKYGFPSCKILDQI